MKKGFVAIRMVLIIGIVSVLALSLIELNKKMLNTIIKSDDTEYMLNACRSIVEFLKSEEETVEEVEVTISFDDFDEIKSEILLQGFSNFLILNSKTQENKRYNLAIRILHNDNFKLFKIKCKGIRGEVELLYAKPL